MSDCMPTPEVEALTGPKRAFAQRAREYALGKHRTYQTQRQGLLAGGAVMLANLVVLGVYCSRSQNPHWLIVVAIIGAIVITGFCLSKSLTKMQKLRQNADLFASFALSTLDTVEHRYNLRLLAAESTAERRAARTLMREAYRVFVNDATADLNAAADKIVHYLRGAP